MSAAVTPAVRDARRNWARALYVTGGAAAAAIAWAVEAPLLGIRLTVRFGAMAPQTVVAGQVVGAALVAGLLGWLLLAALSRRAAGARTGTVWAGVALLVLAVSLALPLAAATTTSAAVGLVVLHLVVAAVVIPGLASTARRAGQ
jgi:hypothetical protein